MNFGDLSQSWPALLVFGLVVLFLAGWGMYEWLKKRPTPAELERERRNFIDAIGKIGDASIAEVQLPLISYTYHVRGIEYSASQEISALEEHLPPGQWAMVGPVSVKYDPRNPANSIILSEQWSGLRRSPHFL